MKPESKVNGSVALFKPWITAFLKLSAVCWLLDLAEDTPLLRKVVSAIIAYALLWMSERRADDVIHK